MISNGFEWFVHRSVPFDSRDDAGWNRSVIGAPVFWSEHEFLNESLSEPLV